LPSLEATLQHCDDSREKAANMLGISMATLYRKIEPKEKIGDTSLAALGEDSQLVGGVLQFGKAF
jgi:Bacterial regulatory protein, Fis family